MKVDSLDDKWLIGGVSGNSPLKNLFYRTMGRAVIWIGFFTIGLLAVPAVLLYAIISAVWRAADKAEEYFEEKGSK